MSDDIESHLRYSVCAQGFEAGSWFGGHKMANESARYLSEANGIPYIVTDTKIDRSQTFEPSSKSKAKRARHIRQAQIEGLKAAIEGECDGLGISDEQAAAILDYVLSQKDLPHVSE